jgi:DNA-binding NarL/FixJ family response regulator
VPSTVVVADDAAEFRAIVRFVLATAPKMMTVVGEAADGEEALALVLSEQPDIVITDMLMPRLNGIELVRRIKEELPGTKVIVMTSYTEDTYRHLALVGGADGFVSKDVLARDLLPPIREIVEAVD